MKVLVTGASGMVGKGVLFECLESDQISSVVVVGRSSCEMQHEKLTEILHDNLADLSSIKDQLTGIDACFFCMGVSVIGLSEEQYHHITYDMTLEMANTLLENNEEVSFCYVSGAGTDTSEKGRQMWARVKGKTENALMALPFKDSFMFRPGFIKPMKGVRSKVRAYRIGIAIVNPLYPVFKVLFPGLVTTSVNVGKAMIVCVTNGAHTRILENKDINKLAEQ